MKITASRVASFGPSAFGEMTLLAQKFGAVNLGQGFPDFAPPAFVLEAAREAFAGAHHQYAPPKGWPRLARAIAQTLEPQLGFAADPDTEVTVLVGATQALHATMQALIDPGDEIIIMEPKFDTYTPQAMLSEAVPIYVQLEPTEDGWELNLEQLRAACSGRTKLLIVNTPHNPTGKVFTRSELEAMAALALEFDFFVIADEVYDRLVFGVDHLSFASLPGMRERTITIGSAGKMFSVTGWRIGWTIASPSITTAIRNGLQWTSFAATTPTQEAVALCLERAAGLNYDSQLRTEFLEKRDFLLEALRVGGFKPYVPDGAYYIVADASKLTDNAMAFSSWMVKHAGLAAMPSSVFYIPEHEHLAPPSFRFAFCKSAAVLEAATEKLSNLQKLL